MSDFTQKSIALLERNKKEDVEVITNYQQLEKKQSEEITQEEAEQLRSGIKRLSYKNNLISEEDLSQLVSISATLRTSHKNHVLFHGRNIHKAQDLLKKQKRGAFSFWLAFTYGSRQTCYNFLNYFLLYSALPKEIRPQFEKMPLKSAYLIGSIEMDSKKKVNLIESYRGEKFKEWKEVVVSNSHPNSKPTKKMKNKILLKTSLNTLKKVEKKHGLTEESKSIIKEIRALLEKLDK